MKRIILCLTLVLLLVPAGTALAQDDSPNRGRCAPEDVLENLTNDLDRIDELSDLEPFLLSTVETVLTCGEQWLLLLGDLLGLSDSGASGTDAGAVPIYDPNDLISSSFEAEYALERLYAGDLERALPFFCEADQADFNSADAEDLADNVTLNSVDCRAIGSTQFSCQVDALVFGEAFEDTLVFDIQDGKICSTD